MITYPYLTATTTTAITRDEMALAEEERQFSSERAVHHKVRNYIVYVV